MHILLLEDNSNDANLTQIGLERLIHGCKVEICPTLKHAKEILSKDFHFDIALLDMQLPDGTGLDMLMEIRLSGLKLPVIMITGSGNEEIATTVLKAGADDYVIKRQGYIETLPSVIGFAIKSHHQKNQELKEVIDVLYIEHHSTDIDLTLRHMKQFAPYIRINFVSTAEEALNFLGSQENKTLKYKVLLLDYHLPGINALEFIKIVRQEKKIAIPIILVSGQGNEDVAIQALKLGANDYIVKRENYLYRLPSAIQNAYQHFELINKQAELTLSESKYRLLADNSGDVIFLLDKDLNYKYVSPAVRNLRGFEPDEVIGHNIIETLTTESYERALKTLNEILTAHENKNAPIQKIIELELLRKDGTTVWTEVKISVSIEDKKNVTGILGVTRDITEKKKEYEKLVAAKEHAEESDRLKSAFLANMSHEIRTPMNGILGFSELLKKPELTGEQQQVYIKIIEKSGARMLNIINDIIDISKIESGQMKVSFSETNVNEQIEFVFNLFKTEAEQKKLQLSYQNFLPDKEAIILSDREKIYAILINLVKNAIKFTKSGFIEFGYFIDTKIKNNSRNVSDIEFYVKDSGIGIPKNRQEAIFERFIQADIADIMAHQGAGLGLSIAKAYVEMLGGKIRVESEEDKGSIFHFTLPCKQVSKEINWTKKEVLTSTNKTKVKKLKILIVEDDEESTILINIALKSLSDDIITSNNGEEAVEICRMHPDIDLILMDIKLPLINGYEATRLIRLFNTKVIIIAQTAYALAGDREKSIDAGCNDYISKPIIRNQLIKLIENYF